MLGPVLRGLQPAELFSPFGIDEIRRSLGEDRAASLLEEPGLEYAIAEGENVPPALGEHDTRQLAASDIALEKETFGLKMSDWDASPPEDKVWGFVSCDGQDWAAIAVIRWHEGAVGSISIAGTKPVYQRRNHGRAVVSAATDYILRHGRVATYGTVQSNLAAVRMIRPLGYELAHETIYA